MIKKILLYSTLFTVLLTVVLLGAEVQAKTTRFKAVKNLTATYNETKAKVVVSWKKPNQAKRFQIRIYQAGDIIARAKITKRTKKFDPALFTENETYKIWVRALATKQYRTSRWKKTSFVFTTDTTDDEEDTDEDEDEEDSGELPSVYYDQTFLTISSDPNTFSDSTTVIFDHASVPEAIRLSTASEAGDINDVLMYYIDFTNYQTSGDEVLMMSRSTDNGTTWSDPVTVEVLNKQNAGATVDPSVVQLDDGSLRLYFFGSEAVGSSDKQLLTQPQTEGNVIYSAVSDDGVTFTVEDGTRLNIHNMTDPEVIYFNDQWIMYYSLGITSGIATSSDGLTFTNQSQTWSGGGVPGAYVEENTVVRIFGCNSQIYEQTSTLGTDFSNGSAFLALSGDGDPCDPSPVLLEDGRVLMVYKKNSQ